VYGNSIHVGESQYPAIYNVVKQASEALQLPSLPEIFILQGHGMVELFVAKRFSRRGMIIVTSNLLDDLAVSGDTRRLMMVVGRQLGHIAGKHFDWWLLKDVVGALTFFVYTAYRRRCHYTADRIGLLVAGDLQEGQSALLTLTVGKTLVAETNFTALKEQRAELSESFFAWLREIFAVYPYMICRLVALEEFFRDQQGERIRDNRGQPIQVLNIAHYHLTGVTIGTQVIGEGATVTVAAE
jgi:Zn-dependent protease with chaperone function